MVKNSRKPHTTMRGKVIDMDLLRKKNELTPAVGNARVNARGDELGPGGKIVRKREEIVKEFYESNPNSVKVDTGIQKPETSTIQEPKVEDTVEPKIETKATTENKAESKTTTRKNSQPTAKETKLFEEFDEGWEEDQDGNFVKKGKK